jgi:hypothetical protein
VCVGAKPRPRRTGQDRTFIDCLAQTACRSTYCPTDRPARLEAADRKPQHRRPQPHRVTIPVRADDLVRTSCVGVAATPPTAGGMRRCWARRLWERRRPNRDACHRPNVSAAPGRRVPAPDELRASLQRTIAACPAPASVTGSSDALTAPIHASSSAGALPTGDWEHEAPPLRRMPDHRLPDGARTDARSTYTDAGRRLSGQAELASSTSRPYARSLKTRGMLCTKECACVQRRVQRARNSRWLSQISRES